MIRTALAATLALGLTLAAAATSTASATGTASTASATSTATVDKAAGTSVRHIAFTDWKTPAQFGTGTTEGTAIGTDGLTIGTPVGTRDYTDPFGSSGTKTYDYATWISPTVNPGFNLTELVSSWNASTPAGTWIQMEVRGKGDDGLLSKWYILGRWSADDPDAGGAIYRTSVPSQGDSLAYVAVDTLVALKGRSLSDWQLRVTLFREHGTTATPTVRLVGAMASALPDSKKVPVSPLGGAEGITLDVPTYSQEIHRGQYPQWDNGGEAWCSPTSTAMVLGYWNTGPTPQDYSWVDPSYADPWVDYAARNTFDYSYDGAGNWPFNTAYAARYGLESFVTRLRSLTEAEQFIKAGIPLVVSVSFKKSELDGAGYGTNGHLMVIVGFTQNGDVVVNDPASHLIPSDDAVRTVYDRAQFENVWVPHSGGIAYVIHPAGVPLPPSPAEANW